MRNILFAVRSLKKQFFSSIIVIIEVIISIMMFSELYTYISDRLISLRTIEEMQNEKLYVFDEFEYYYSRDTELISGLSKDPSVKRIGQCELFSCETENGNANLAAYNHNLTELYVPKLQNGTWLNGATITSDAIPAVVTAEFGFQLGDMIDLILENGSHLLVQVIGVLNQPTQYLFPSGSSDAVDSLIAHEPSILIRLEDFKNVAEDLHPDLSLPRILFVETTSTVEALKVQYNKYASIRPINTMIESFSRSSNELIASELMMLILFLVLSSIVIINAEVIHAKKAGQRYTIYYLLGMKWENRLHIEIWRQTILICVAFCIGAVLNQHGALKTAYLSGNGIMFYVVLLIYLICLFFGNSIYFSRRLAKTDISTALKDLEGE